MLQNARGYRFQLLRLNQQGGKLPPTPPLRLGLTSKFCKMLIDPNKVINKSAFSKTIKDALLCKIFQKSMHTCKN